MDYSEAHRMGIARTLLVAEDHQAMRSMLLSWLGTTFPDYVCLGAVSGEDAIELVLARSPTLVLMDFALPGINGSEATRRIKQIAPGTTVILLSMCEADAYQAEAAAAGASAYLFKRNMHTELIPTLQSFLSLPTDGPPTAAAKQAVSPPAEQKENV